MTCKWPLCDKPVVPPKRKFCSTDCRDRWHRGNRRAYKLWISVDEWVLERYGRKTK